MKHMQVVVMQRGPQMLYAYGGFVAAFVPGRGYMMRDDWLSPSVKRRVLEWAHPEAPEVINARAIMDAVNPPSCYEWPKRQNEEE
ncbi:hypothetical protein PHO31112_01637 [Pandoraea horticolens]|uniref:Uncharacterized protein n=1 Tax=Pandoraea horticolens TaxID=2508298 RepID=A0A5E4TU72_9BURK|nr:hypothetical protein [Pandoraea horticolens]VVD91347.1 hypothetical protein PHO31112_01637 [Pandoraea horticolens]